jgi:hypothetical protein
MPCEMSPKATDIAELGQAGPPYLRFRGMKAGQTSRRPGRLAARTVVWVGGPLAIAVTIAGLLVLASGHNDSGSCKPSPTSSACHLSTPLEVVGLVLLVVGVIGVLGAAMARRAGGRDPERYVPGGRDIVRVGTNPIGRQLWPRRDPAGPQSGARRTGPCIGPSGHSARPFRSRFRRAGAMMVECRTRIDEPPAACSTRCPSSTTACVRPIPMTCSPTSVRSPASARGRPCWRWAVGPARRRAHWPSAAPR